jgi:hypothetical protein
MGFDHVREVLISVMQTIAEALKRESTENPSAFPPFRVSVISSS